MDLQAYLHFINGTIQSEHNSEFVWELKGLHQWNYFYSELYWAHVGYNILINLGRYYKGIDIEKSCRYDTINSLKVIYKLREYRKIDKKIKMSKI